MTTGTIAWKETKPRQRWTEMPGRKADIAPYLDHLDDIKERKEQRDARRQQLVESARATDLVQLVGRYTQLRRKATGEYEGPCPKCAGTDRFTVDSKGWFCRTCKPYDQAHGWFGAIDFVMWQHGMDFKTAVGFLTGAQMAQAVTQRVTAPAQPERSEPTEEWRVNSERIVTETQHALFHADMDGAEYLTARGLEPHTWQAFGWGFGPGWYSLTRQLLPAIVIPWYRAGKLMAIRYRFLNPPVAMVEGKPRSEKIVSLVGSKFGAILYGGQALEPGAEGTRTLVLCEGEINAASIWQAAYESRLDVLSVGSESARLTDAMTSHAAKYRHIIVWMDKREVAAKLRDQLPPRTVAVSSPLRPGPDGKETKLDANDMLRIGKLGAFLTAVRVKACGEDAAAREGLLWDIWDMAARPLGIDPGTGAAALKLAAELGKDVKLYECPDGAWRVL